MAFTSGTNLIVYLWTDFCLYSLLSHYVPRFVKSSLSTLSNRALQHVVQQNTTDGLLINRPSHMECYKHDSTTHLQKYTQTDIQCNHTPETRLHILTHKHESLSFLFFFFSRNTNFWGHSFSFLEKHDKTTIMISKMPHNLQFFVFYIAVIFSRPAFCWTESKQWSDCR